MYVPTTLTVISYANRKVVSELVHGYRNLSVSWLRQIHRDGRCRAGVQDMLPTVGRVVDRRRLPPSGRLDRALHQPG